MIGAYSRFRRTEEKMAQKETDKSTAVVKKTSPFEFVQQVRQETSKVTWPTRQETVVTTIMVFIMITIMSIFFLGVDSVLRLVITFLLGLGQ